MKNLFSYTLLLPAIFLPFISCTPPPELPVIPSIVFKNVKYVETEGADSLIVTIEFKDGDGDLGLTSDDILAPYQPYFDSLDDNQDTIKFGSRPGLPEYNPIDYVIRRDAEGTPIDTLLVRINDNHYNYFVHFYQKKNGRYTEFNWRDKPYYQTFDGRFPLLNTSGKSKPLEGELRYSMVSSGWIYIFRDSMRLVVQIQDRALHKSNIVESPAFILEGIK